MFRACAGEVQPGVHMYQIWKRENTSTHTSKQADDAGMNYQPLLNATNA